MTRNDVVNSWSSRSEVRNMTNIYMDDHKLYLVPYTRYAAERNRAVRNFVVALFILGIL